MEQGQGGLEGAAWATISKREREVFTLLAAGYSNKQIAGVLNISVRTTESHRFHVMHKLNVRSLSELIRLAIRNKIVEP